VFINALDQLTAVVSMLRIEPGNQSFVHQHGLAYIAVSYESDSDEQLDAHLRTGTEFPFIKSHVRG